ncbi:MAG: ABC transporter ATP-binding protein [Candidatus Omnitrophica bacterium]|nr:ABC transporter ATP-binding protein [Candidatus Omnitrophota bacterium]
MGYLVETHQLTKIFKPHKGIGEKLRGSAARTEVKAVDRVSFSLEAGSTMAIMGPNAAGKTTLLKLIASLIIPTSGRISVKGTIGLVTGEERSFYWRLSGQQNLEFFAALYGLGKSEAKRRIQQLVELLGIEDMSDVLVQEYSSGYKQRLAIARGLLHDPDILLLDEPTKNLDSSHAEHLRIFIRENLGKESKKTVIFTSHNLEEASFLANKLAVMDKGCLRQQDS